MPPVALHALVAARLADTPVAVPGADTLVLAAFEGTGSVLAALEGTMPPAQPAASRQQLHSAATHLESLTVAGFRGVGPAVTLQLEARPGLTLLVGRNGSGKSSFAEALEMLLTGTNRRWAERAKVWADGWRNLHAGVPRLTASFRVDGRATPLVIERTWADGAAATDSTLTVDGKRRSLDDSGWTHALQAYPPLLSHNELGRILDKPSELYDALSSILGLEAIADAQAVLRELRLAAAKVVKIATDQGRQLVAMLQDVDDERARAAVAALSAKSWRLDDIDAVLGRSEVSEQERSELGLLRSLAQLPVVEREQARGVTAQVRDAQQLVERQRGSDAARARETAALLRQALRVHSEHEHDRTCPVCGTTDKLTTEWRLATTTRITELEAEATALAEVDRTVAAARAAVRGLIHPVPAVLGGDVPAGIDVRAAHAAWAAWADLAHDGDLRTVATHIETHAPRVIEAVSAVRQAATAELERREDLWRPAARTLSAWLVDARHAETQRERLPRIKAAEDWLIAQHQSLREERFAPIATEVQTLWSDLRQSSNVQLGALKLEGERRSAQRRVALDVNIDGSDASALGVMSQGELNCLALSLFLPRAAMPESPFRFIVIDDPVQAMDEVKVEGLARALAHVATTRQVLVLTHDERLPVALRRLELEATVLEVSRREQSVVQVQTRTDPVQRYIDDAMAVAQTAGVPAAAGRVVPGFCRMALEAACSAAVWKRLVDRGTTFAAADARLAEPTTLNMWLALVMFDDVGRAGEVMAALNQRGRASAADVVKICNRGAHSAVGNDAVDLVRKTELLAKAIRQGSL